MAKHTMLSHGRVVKVSTRALLAAAVGMAPLALGAPQGPQNQVGVQSISIGPTTVVTGQGSHTIVDWEQFNVGSSEAVQFRHATLTEGGRFLNRVIGVGGAGPEMSQILGTIDAGNHIVYLVNPAGVFFGPGSQVINASAFVAAAGSITNDSFAAINLADGNLGTFTDIQGTITNQGSISASNLVALLGSQVQNFGSIVLDGLGSGEQNIMLIAGPNATLMRQRLGAPISAVITNTGGSTMTGPGVDNQGTIDAGDGRLLMQAGDMYALAVNNSGDTFARTTELRGQHMTGSDGTIRGEELIIRSATGVGTDGTLAGSTGPLNVDVEILRVVNSGTGSVHINHVADDVFEMEVAELEIADGTALIQSNGAVRLGAADVNGLLEISAQNDITVYWFVTAQNIAFLTPGVIVLEVDGQLDTTEYAGLGYGGGSSISLWSSGVDIFGSGYGSTIRINAGNGTVVLRPWFDDADMILGDDTSVFNLAAGLGYGYGPSYSLSGELFESIAANTLLFDGHGNSDIYIGHIKPQSVASLIIDNTEGSDTGAGIQQLDPSTDIENIAMGEGGLLNLVAGGDIGQVGAPLLIDVDQLIVENLLPGTVNLFDINDLQALTIYTTSGDIALGAMGMLTAVYVEAHSHITMNSGGDMNAGTLSASEDINLTARNGTMTINTLTAGRNVNLTAGGDILASRPGSTPNPHINANNGQGLVNMSAGGDIGSAPRPIFWRGRSISTSAGGSVHINPSGMPTITGGGGPTPGAASTSDVSNEIAGSSELRLPEERRRQGEGREGLAALWVVGEFLETLGWLDTHPQLVEVDTRWGQVLASYIEVGLQERGKRTAGVGPTVSAEQTESLMDQGLQYQVDGVIESLEVFEEAGEPMARLTVVYELKKNVSKQLRLVQKMRLRTDNNSQPEVTRQDLDTLMQMTAGRIVDNVVEETPAGMMGVRG